jgi:hypothetical protein
MKHPPFLITKQNKKASPSLKRDERLPFPVVPPSLPHRHSEKMPYCTATLRKTRNESPNGAAYCCFQKKIRFGARLPGDFLKRLLSRLAPIPVRCKIPRKILFPFDVKTSMELIFMYYMTLLPPMSNQ